MRGGLNYICIAK